MAKSIANFESFKRGITWRKSFDAWSGSFNIVSTADYKGRCYSIQEVPGIAARTAKSSIAERLYRTVAAFCAQHQLDLNEVIKLRLMELNKE